MRAGERQHLFDIYFERTSYRLKSEIVYCRISKFFLDIQINLSEFFQPAIVCEEGGFQFFQPFLVREELAEVDVVTCSVTLL